MSLLDNDVIKTITSLPYAMDLPENFDPTTMGQMVVLDRRAGDLKIIWDRTKPDEVENAKSTFDNLKKKGYAAFQVKDKDGNKGDVVREFDPNIERLIFIAPMAGG